MSDRLDGRMAPLRPLALLAAVAVLGCSPLNPAVAPPVPPDGGTPCTREVAVASDSVVIAAATCNPWCIHVPAGTPVYFFNQDPTMYLFMASPALPYDIQVPGYAGTVTLPLARGTVTWTAVHQQTASVTVFVE